MGKYGIQIFRTVHWIMFVLIKRMDFHPFFYFMKIKLYIIAAILVTFWIVNSCSPFEETQVKKQETDSVISLMKFHRKMFLN